MPTQNKYHSLLTSGDLERIQECLGLIDSKEKEVNLDRYVADREIILTAYRTLPAEVLKNLPNKGKVRDGHIDVAIQNEVFKDHRPGMRTFQPTDYLKLHYFINDETHYALEREGYVWQEEKFENLDSSGYNQVRNRVINALVRYSIEYFTNHFGKEPPVPFRTSLKDWVQ